MALGWKLHVTIGTSVAIICYWCAPWLIYPVFMMIFIFLGGALAFLRGGYELRRTETQPQLVLPQVNSSILFRMKVYPPVTIRPTLLSPNVDVCIQKVIDLILKHHVAPLYMKVASKPDQFFSSLRQEIWRVLHVQLDRVSKVDTVKLISADTIETLRKHFIYFRGVRPTQTTPNQKYKFPDINSFPYLVSPEKELEFLRKSVEVLLCVCLPREYLECLPVRVLVREYLVCHIFQPTIDRLCNPDYINQKLLAYLIKQEEITKSAQKRYAHSETYEHFMQHIEKCDDMLELTQIRHNIITDIMQAKAVQHMKDANSTGLRVANLPISISAGKAKSLMERDLKLYITQLTTSKGVCERQIRKLGGEDYQEDQIVDGERAKPDFPRPIPFDTIMMNDIAMMYFLQYLEHCGYGNLLSFWKEVQNLSIVSIAELDETIKHIYTQYLALGSEYCIYPDVDLLIEVERTLGNDTGECLDALAKLQEMVYHEIHEQHYESFIHSESFREFMEGEAENEEMTSFIRYKRSTSPAVNANEDSIHHKKLKTLKMELHEKESTLAIIPRTRSDTITQVRILEKGRNEIQEEIKQLQRYIEHTEEWFGTVGQWNVEVSNVDLSAEEGRDKDPLILIVVHRPNVSEQTGLEEIRILPLDPKMGGESTTTSSEVSSQIIDDDGFISIASDPEDEMTPKHSGWVIGRHLSEFQELHTKIRQVRPNLQFPPIPKKTMFSLQRREAEKKYWDKYCQVLQVYLNKIVHDPKLQESEVVFNFLSPASADLCQSGVFKDVRQNKSLFRETKTDEHILDHVSSLISEVFDLQERSRVLRRQLYELVQLTFGRSIEGELQDFMKWVVSEPMLVYYIETFQESLWPDGQPAPPAPLRSDEQKEETKEDAQQRFMKCAPQTLQTILGQRNCQIGFLKMFSAFQDPRANKQLFYSYFELLLYAIVPELEKVEVDTTNTGD